MQPAAKDRLSWLLTCTTRQLKEYEHSVKLLDCVVCGATGPSDKHHCLGSQWPAKRQHRPCIPLCKEHHQGNTGIHMQRKTFEATHGTQMELVEKTEKMLQGGW